MSPLFERKPRPSRELRPNELETLQRDLARVIMRRGHYVHYEGRYPINPGDKLPEARQGKADIKSQQKLFGETGSLLIPTGTPTFEYLEPHKINPHYDAPLDPVYEHLSLNLDWRLRTSGVAQQDVYWMQRADGEMTGGVTVELSRGGRRISPNNITRERNETDEEVMEFIRDLHALERPLSATDADRMRKLARAIR